MTTARRCWCYSSTAGRELPFRVQCSLIVSTMVFQVSFLSITDVGDITIATSLSFTMCLNRMNSACSPTSFLALLVQPVLRLCQSYRMHSTTPVTIVFVYGCDSTVSTPLSAPLATLILWSTAPSSVPSLTRSVPVTTRFFALMPFISP